MDTATIYNSIRQIVELNLPGSRVLLFGSRARGDHDCFSDYDLLVITPQTITPKEKIYWSTRLDRAIVENVNIPIDLLLNSEEEVRQKQELPGHIIRSVMREGIVL